MAVPDLRSESITYQKLQFLCYQAISGNLRTFSKAAVSLPAETISRWMGTEDPK